MLLRLQFDAPVRLLGQGGANFTAGNVGNKENETILGAPEGGYPILRFLNFPNQP
jgi:hypothetical protein